jgi:hypothetical protein
MRTETQLTPLPQKLPGALPIGLGLLVFSVFLNYVDRFSACSSGRDQWREFKMPRDCPLGTQKELPQSGRHG